MGKDGGRAVRGLQNARERELPLQTRRLAHFDPARRLDELGAAAHAGEPLRAIFERRRASRPLDLTDDSMAQSGKMLCDHRAPSPVVAERRGKSGAGEAAHCKDDGNLFGGFGQCGGVLLGRSQRDDRVYAPGKESAKQAPELVRPVPGFTDQGNDARRLGRVPVQISYGLANDAHENLIQEVRRQNADRSRAPATQRRGGGVRAEAETRRLRADPLPRRLGYKMRLILAQRPRDRRAVHAQPSTKLQHAQPAHDLTVHIVQRRALPSVRPRFIELVAGVVCRCNRLTWRGLTLSVPRNATRRRSRLVVPIDMRASAKRRSVTASKVCHRDRPDCTWSDFTEPWLSESGLEAPASNGPRESAIVRFPGAQPDATGHYPLINDRMVLQ